MRFLIDRCAGHLLAEWLRRQGHNVVESQELGPDLGDRALLEIAASEQRILVTIDTVADPLRATVNSSGSALRFGDETLSVKSSLQQ